MIEKSCRKRKADHQRSAHDHGRQDDGHAHVPFFNFLPLIDGRDPRKDLEEDTERERHGDCSGERPAESNEVLEEDVGEIHRNDAMRGVRDCLFK